ncbi:MAG: anaerobic ribonucleoside-triphosphate reductase, partial [Lachnospiraceae bacterium]|nr:anaerobic ribonucleoside-triphosphate reductase [Lachnospiraceae bacterium]
MKVVKRDGRIVDYDRNKIVVAIRKANAEVDQFERLADDKIDGIVASIENMKRETMQVEDIQDIIEQKLMAAGKFVLAKTYIIYRYTREMVRKANTTDDSIMSLIQNRNKSVMEENSNKNAYIASTQRDLIAGEVSKDLTKRVLLPEKITKAHEEGVLHFHDMDYFIQPIFNCCLINIGDMLENGTVMNGKLIESPKSFQVACTVVTQIISAGASSQYGGQSVDVRHLGKYLRKSAEKYRSHYMEKYGEKVDAETIEQFVNDRLHDELRSGVQTIQYQINTLMTTNGQSPFVTLFLNLDKDDEYIEENAMIIEEILRQRLEGIKNEKGVFVTPAFPKLIYVLDEHNCLKGGKYDYITRLAVRCSAKRMYPDYISAKKMRDHYEGNVYSCMGCRSFLTPWKDENG